MKSYFLFFRNYMVYLLDLTVSKNNREPSWMFKWPIKKIVVPRRSAFVIMYAIGQSGSRFSGLLLFSLAKYLQADVSGHTSHLGFLARQV